MAFTNSRRLEDFVPTTDKQCGWDYGGKKCKHPAYCRYRYKFGDIHHQRGCAGTAAFEPRLMSCPRAVRRLKQGAPP